MLLQVFLKFLKLGSLGFGGPLALIALMDEECVQKERWITPSEFQQTFSLVKMFPGPLAFQMALWLGYRRAGILGGLLTGIAFLLPGVSAILLLAVSYQWISGFHAVEFIFSGIRAAALWVVLLSIYSMGRPYAAVRLNWMFAIYGAVFWFLFPRWEPVVILLGGVFGTFIHRKLERSRLASPFMVTLMTLFWVHFKAGMTVFGTGLAILPVLQQEIVNHYQWLNGPEFLDAIAFGQLTPGPITIVSTYVGFKSAGLLGAFTATLGMYLPGVILCLGFLPKFYNTFSQSKWLECFSRGAIPTVIGCLFASVYFLARDVFVGWPPVVVFAICILLQWLRPIPAWALFAVGGLIGGLFSL